MITIGSRMFRLITIGARMFNLIAIELGGLG